MQIGITGSKGVLGKKLIKSLNNHIISKFVGDISNEKDVEKWIKNSNFDMIIHLAAVVPVNLVNKNKIKAKKVNFIGTKILIKKIKKYYSKKIWFFYASTSHVYKRTHLKINEKSEIRPINYYALTKHKSEKYLIKNSNVVNYCIGRIFSFTSKKQSNEFIIPKLIQKLKNNDNKIFLKNLNHYRDFLPINDIISAIKILIVNKKKGIFNICSSKGILLSDIANKLNFKKKKLIFKNSKTTTIIVGSNRKLKSLNWKPTYTNYLNYISKYEKNNSF